jgi:FeoB-associated Cys-rich membrane protein
MLQVLITVIIVVAALGFGIYRTVRSLRNPLRGCDDCEKNCSGCSLEDLKKEIEGKKSKNNQ